MESWQELACWQACSGAVVTVNSRQERAAVSRHGRQHCTLYVNSMEVSIRLLLKVPSTACAALSLTVYLVSAAGSPIVDCACVVFWMCRSNVSLVVLVVEGTRGIEFMFGIILSVVIANWVAHHIHHDGVYESELERIGNLYFLRDEPPHR